MDNTNTRQLPFCIAGALFIYMGVSRIIGSVFSSIIYAVAYGADMDNLLRNMFTFSNMLQIMVLIGLGVFLLIRKIPVVSSVLIGCMSLFSFISLIESRSAVNALDALFEFSGYAVLFLISLGVFTNFKALSKVWFLPIILILAMKPITFIEQFTRFYRPPFIIVLSVFSTIMRTAVLTVALILLCKWYKKVIVLIEESTPPQPTYAQPVYAQPVYVQPPVPTPAVQLSSEAAAELAKYQQLLVNGQISSEQYEEIRKQLLNLQK